jgi:hypothetical protein
VPRIHQIDLKSPSVEDLVQRDPVDTGRLHRDGGYTTLRQPIRQPMQIGGEALEPADRVRIPIWPDGDVMCAATDVDPGGVGLHHLQARVSGPEPPGQFFPLLPGDSSCACDCHAGAPLMSETRGGPVAMGV